MKSRSSWCSSAAAVLALASFGCGGGSPAPTAPPEGPRPPSSAAASPLFSSDDFDAALARARAESKLLFVDAWAPWCHTCLSMQAEVLEEPDVRAFADRVTFVALDTDKPVNAAFLEAYAVRVWPTFYAIDPVTRAPIAAYGGSLSKEETVRFLHTALDARKALAGGGGAASEARALADGHAHFAAREYTAAERSYREALALRGPRVGEAHLGVVRSLERTDPSACVAFAGEEMGRVEGAATPIDFVVYALACAKKLPEGGDTAARREAVQRAARDRLGVLARRTDGGASVDDRADALANLAEVDESLGDPAAARTAHEERLALLLDAVTRARGPGEARVHDYARMVSYLYLGRGDEAARMLEERTRQFPDDYEPWARLASTLHKIGREADALRAVDRTLALAYGPRALRYRTLRADVLAKLDRLPDAIAELERAAADCDALPKGHRDPERCAEIRADLTRRTTPHDPSVPPAK